MHDAEKRQQAKVWRRVQASLEQVRLKREQLIRANLALHVAVTGLSYSFHFFASSQGDHFSSTNSKDGYTIAINSQQWFTRY